MLFPTLRYLRAASPVSSRLRRVQQWPLLLLRLAIVGAVCAAAAGPTLAVSWRQATWRERLHRIIVVDVGLTAADVVVAELQRSAVSSVVIGPQAIVDTLDAAIAQAEAVAPRLRTEVVLVWDGSQARLSAADVGDIPAPVGVRLVVQDRAAAAPAAPDARTLADALRLHLPADAAGLEQQLRARLDALRLPAPLVRITGRWDGARILPTSANESRMDGVLHAHVERTLEDIAADPRVRDAAARSTRTAASNEARTAPVGSMVLARATDGTPLLRGASDGNGLVLDFATTPRSPLTWWAIVSAGESLAGLEVRDAGRWSGDDVASAGRPAPSPPAAALPGGLDTRAAWVVVLALLAIEQLWRRRPTAGQAAAPAQEPRVPSPQGSRDAA